MFDYRQVGRRDAISRNKGVEILRPETDGSAQLDYDGAAALATKAAQREPVDAGILLRAEFVEQEGDGRLNFHRSLADASQRLKVPGASRGFTLARIAKNVGAD
jgi:hypothetical protein